jgi:hypothetical protein
MDPPIKEENQKLTKHGCDTMWFSALPSVIEQIFQNCALA